MWGGVGVGWQKRHLSTLFSLSSPTVTSVITLLTLQQHECYRLTSSITKLIIKQGKFVFTASPLTLELDMCRLYQLYYFFLHLDISRWCNADELPADHGWCYSHLPPRVNDFILSSLEYYLFIMKFSYLFRKTLTY